jgi:RNA polymerase sigma-70 factor, ECF subfamily
MDDLVSSEAFVELLTMEQQGLFAYIMMQVPNIADANDVLQETNLVLWRKQEEFRVGAPFGPWARSIAHYQVLAFSKRRSRDRLRFGEPLLTQLAQESMVYEARSINLEQTALGQCTEELELLKQKLLQMRYSDSLSIVEIAAKTGQSSGAVSDALYRIRIQLAKCIENRLKRDRQDR